MTLWLWASSSRSWWSLPRSSGRWSSCGKCWAEELGIAYRSGVAVSYSPCLVRLLVRCGPLPHQTVSLVLASAVPERARLSREIQSEACDGAQTETAEADRKSTRLNSSHLVISYAVFCLKKKKKNI